jgi:PPOX class probable F420-dependent enzyme
MGRSCSSARTCRCRTVAGSSDPAVVLTAADRALLAEARTATLATIDPHGRPRLVPICHVVDDDGVVWSPLDDKPKAVDDVRGLARVRDVLRRPEVALLVQRWSEDWTELAWLRLAGRAALVEPADVPGAVVIALRRRYPQYADHDLEHRPMLRMVVERATRWAASGSSPRPASSRPSRSDRAGRSGGRGCRR